MLKTQRKIAFYDVSLKGRSSEFQAPSSMPLRIAFNILMALPVSARIVSFNNKLTSFYISQLSQDGQLVSILLNKSDRAVADPVFSDPAKRVRRTAQKTVQEGQDYSVHVLIRLPLNDVEPALALVEVCRGFSIGSVAKMLDSILRSTWRANPKYFRQTHPDGSIDDDGKPKVMVVSQSFEFFGHVSLELAQDLEGGTIRDVELISNREVNTDFDQGDYLVQRRRSIVLGVKDSVSTLGILAKLRNTFSRQKPSYDRAVVKFKTSENQDRVAEYDIENGRFEGYVKKEVLDGFEYELKSSYDDFCVPILARMKTLILKETGG
jgi:hypothetical protein